MSIKYSDNKYVHLTLVKCTYFMCHRIHQGHQCQRSWHRWHK